MLARSLPSQLHQPSTSASLRATPAPHGRAVVSCRALPLRSSSPRAPGDWRSSWRDELEHGTNGNGNGNGQHTQSSSNDVNGTSYGHDDDYTNPDFFSNGTGYRPLPDDVVAQDDVWGSASWRTQTAAVEQEQPWQVSEPYGSQQQQERDSDDEDDDHFHRRIANWRLEHSAQSSRTSSYDSDDEVSPAAAAEEEAAGGSLFPNGFKDAFKDALKRSPLYASRYGGAGSGDEEDMPPQPTESPVETTANRPIFTDAFRSVLKASMERTHAEMDAKYGYASDDDYVPVPYKTPAPERKKNMSPMEEILASALSASQLTVRRLTAIKNEIDLALERENKQVERLDFALKKCETDEAYYKSVERMLNQERLKSGK